MAALLAMSDANLATAGNILWTQRTLATRAPDWLESGVQLPRFEAPLADSQ